MLLLLRPIRPLLYLGMFWVLVSCESTPTPVAPTPAPAPAPAPAPTPSFTVDVNSALDYVFFSVFGTEAQTAQMNAQRSDGGSIANGAWSSSNTSQVTISSDGEATAVAAGNPAMQFTVDTVAGSKTIMSRPNLGSIQGTYQVTSCTDSVSPALSPSLCAPGSASGYAVGETGDFFLELTTDTNSGMVSGSFEDSRTGGAVGFFDFGSGTSGIQINPPVMIGSSGTVEFDGVRSGDIAIDDGGGVGLFNNLPTAPLRTTVQEQWRVTSSTTDELTGTSTLEIQVNDRTGQVVVERTIQSAREREDSPDFFPIPF